MIVFEILAGPGAPRTLELSGTWLTVGRQPTCDFVLSDPKVSNEHFVVQNRDGVWELTDLMSTSGTLVDGSSVAGTTALHVGARVIVGDTELRITWDEQADTGLDATLPSMRPSEHDPQIVLVGLSAPFEDQRFPVTGTMALVGSGAQCEIQLPDIPPFAVRLLLGPGYQAVETLDGGEAHVLVAGAFVDGQAPLRDGSVLQIGPHRFRVEDPMDATAVSPGGDDTIRMARKPPPDLARTLTPRELSRAPTPVDVTEAPVLDTRDWDLLTDEETAVVDPTSAHVPEELEVPQAIRLRARFNFLQGPHMGRQVLLGSAPVTFGRSIEASVRLFDALVSRRHLRVSRAADGRVTVEDLGGVNGTLVNGRKLASGEVCALEHRDLVTVGASVMEFSSAGLEDEEVDPTTTVRLLPRFCFAGTVVEKERIQIGRDHDKDVVLEHDDQIDRHHFDLEWRGLGFAVVDWSRSGTFVGGERVVDREIQESAEITAGAHTFHLEIDGSTCRLDIVRPRTPAFESGFTAAVDTFNPYATMVRVPLPRDEASKAAGGEGEAEQAARRKIFWRKPWDVVPSRRLRAVAITALACGLCVAAGLALLWRGAFVEAPPSPAHNSQAFVDQAGSGAGCATCHVPFGGASSERCATCHADHLEHGSHEAVACGHCHREHPTTTPAPSSLLARQRCDTCHLDKGVGRHEGLLAGSVGPPRVMAGVEKPPRIRAGVGADELHDIHESVAGRCNACHATAEHGQMARPRETCLRCHGSNQQLTSGRCEDCHQPEHRGAALLAGVRGGPEPFDFVGTGPALILGVLLLAPLLIALRVFRERAPGDAEDSDVEAGELPSEPEAAKLAIDVHPDLCVGGGECVSACPYGVLKVVHLPSGRHVARVINMDSCNECGTCESACAPRALTRHVKGKPIPPVKQPDLDANFMTRVPGLYLVGEAMGMSLIRNANNLGARTVRHILSAGVTPGTAEAMGLDCEVAIVGGGPAGLSAGLTAVEENLRHVVFEKGHHWAQTIYDFQNEKHVQNQPASMKVIGALPVAETNREALLEMWTERLAQTPELDLVLNHEVVGVEPLAGEGEPCRGFKLTGKDGSSRTAARVVVAVGARSNPNRLRCPGADLPKIRYKLREPKDHDGDHIVIVGTGNAGLEVASALTLANGRSNRVTLLNRETAGDGSPTGCGPAGFPKASALNVEKIVGLAKAFKDAKGKETESNLKILYATETVELTENEITVGPAKNRDGTARREGEPTMFENHYVYAMIGARPPIKWLESIGVNYALKPKGWMPARSDDQSFLEPSDT